MSEYIKKSDVEALIYNLMQDIKSIKAELGREQAIESVRKYKRKLLELRVISILT